MKRQRNERYAQQAKRSLFNYTEKQAETIMIGALAAIEDNFGFLWGHGKDYNELTDNQKKIRDAWQTTRTKILDLGNSRISLIEKEFSYFIIEHANFNYDLNGKSYKVIEPTINIDSAAKKIYMSEYNKALKNDSVPRDRLDEKLKELGLLSQEDYDRMDKLRNEIDELIKPLKTGGIKLKEMKERAEKAQLLRLQLYSLISYRTKYDDLTAESVAEDARFNFLVYSCLLDDSGKKVFNSYQDWESCTDNELLEKAASNMIDILYPERGNVFLSLPENEFLVKYGFYNKDLTPVNAVKEEAFKPFLDDEDKPIEVPVEQPVA
jgi:hypothetical protein